VVRPKTSSVLRAAASPQKLPHAPPEHTPAAALRARSSFIVGALGRVGKVRPIVHDPTDYPESADGECVFRGKPMDKGYHTHYVSVDASGDYEAFREGQSPQPKRADELVFAQDAQLLPNLLIYFRWAA